MKDFLKKLIAAKKAELTKQTERMKASTNLDEVRALGETLIALRDEIADAEAQLAALDDNDNGGADEGASNNPDGGEGRSAGKASRGGLNPLATYGQNTNGKPSQTRASEDDPRATMEYRSAFMNYVRTGAVSNVLQHRNQNDDQNESTDLGILLPTTVVQEIIKGVEKVYGQLYAKVKKTNIKGGVKYPIGSFTATFHRIGENGAPTDRQNPGSVSADNYVEFSYKLGEIRIAQTLLANVLSVPVFEAELAKVIVEAYVKAMDVEILVGGNATLFPTEYTNQMVGILTEADKVGGRFSTLTDHIVEFTADEMADWKEWQKKLFAKIPLSMRALRPEFVMTANTYEANIKTLHDDNNRPLYAETYNPVDGDERATFKGREVLFVEEGNGIENFDDAEAGDYFGIYWVPERAYAINTNLEFAVKRYFDEEKLQFVDRAVVINDGKILDPKYIWLLKKADET